MVRCMIRSHNQQYKIAVRGDDAENMCGSNLEPDPRYQECCSNIFRPGKVLRDVIVGFLVVLAIAVVVAVLFVVCFYILPATEESTLGGEESAFVGKPTEEEINFNDLNEVELTDSTRYDVRPDVVLENIRKDQAPQHEDADHSEQHHVGPTPEPEGEPEPKVEPEAEPEAEPEHSIEPEPQPEDADTEHIANEGGMAHEQMEGEMHHSEMPHLTGMTHEHMPKEDGEMHHEHMATGGEMHMPADGEMHHSEMSHEHMPGDGEIHHSEMPADGEMHHNEMPHDQMPVDDEMHHNEMPHDHMPSDGEMHHSEVPDDNDMHHSEIPHDHMPVDGEMHHSEIPHDHMTGDSDMHHSEIPHDHMTDEHIMDPESTSPAIFPSAPENEEVLEVVKAPTLETMPSDMPTERTIVSVSSASGPGAKVQIQSSESEGTASPVQTEAISGDHTGIHVNLPPLFETLGFGSNNSSSIPHVDPVAFQPGVFPVESLVPTVAIKEVEAPLLVTEGLPATEITLSGICIPRRLDMCNDLPYDLTSLPNWANDKNEKELNEVSLPFLRDVIVSSGCSPRARQYACSVLEPPCKSDGTILPPCRTFCRSVAATCQEFIISGFSLSDVFSCEKFPDSADPNVCFDMTQAAGDVLFEGLSPLPNLTTIDQALSPSSQPLDLSPEGSPLPDFPEVTLMEEDVSINPVLVEADYPTGAEEEFVPTTIESTAADLTAQDSSIIVPQVTQQEGVGLQNEEPLVVAAWDDSGAEVTQEDTPLTTESSSFTAVTPIDVEGTAGDVASPAEVPLVICDQENFLCHDGSDCVALAAVCDGFQQCSDGSDEFNCTNSDFSSVAPSTNIPALDTAEIQTTLFPEVFIESSTTFPLEEEEKVISEGAATAEFPVETTTSSSSSLGCPELQCLDGTCLALNQLNDGVNDCPDGTDEQDFGSLF